jgi:FeS assembly SUF system regulator
MRKEATMLRMSKLADYGTVIMTYLAHNPARIHSAMEVAHAVGLALPTASKIMKTLARDGLLKSHRGARGGFNLSRPPALISVAAIIRAMDGPVGLTECSNSNGACDKEDSCSVRANWQRISHVVEQALEGVTLADMMHPPQQTVLSLDRLHSTHPTRM